MATVEEGLAAQVRNIEATYGRSMDDWVELIRASGLRRHGEIVVKPAARQLDVALVLPDEPATGRFESAATFNALFTHRVRIGSVADVDDELSDWLHRAYQRAA